MVELAELAAVHEISCVKAQYCRLIDTKRWDALRMILTDDFVFDDPAKDLRCTSPDYFLEFLTARHARSISVHQGVMPDIRVTSPDEADATWAMSDFVQIPRKDDVLVQRGYGYYDDTFRRVNGQWQIAEVRLSRLWLSIETKSAFPA